MASGSPQLIDFAVTRVEHAPWATPAQLAGKQDALGFTPVATDDPRLSDARSPTAHTHPVSDVTDVNTIFNRLLTNGASVLVGNGNALYQAA